MSVIKTLWSMCKRFGAVSLIAVAAASTAQAADELPDAMIGRVSNEMIAAIKADKDAQSGNLKKINDLVENKVMPHVNFQRMTSAAVGRGWRTATPAQQQQLMAEFRTLLLRTYAGALASVKDQTVKMLPLRGDPAAATEVMVRSQIQQPGRDPIQLDYRMEKLAEGWKIYDVNVLGVWLVETYKSQFAQEINAGGVEQLLKSLAEKNKAAGAAK